MSRGPGYVQRAIAAYFEAGPNNAFLLLPATIKEVADHWYEMSDVLVCLEPPKTIFEVDAPDHCLECIWLRDLQKRPDAAAILAKAQQ